MKLCICRSSLIFLERLVYAALNLTTVLFGYMILDFDGGLKGKLFK